MPEPSVARARTALAEAMMQGSDVHPSHLAAVLADHAATVARVEALEADLLAMTRAANALAVETRQVHQALDAVADMLPPR